MRAPLALLAAVSALTLVSCKGDYGPAETCKTMAKQQCRFLYDCCNAVERDTVSGLDNWSPTVGPHGTKAQCEEQYEEIYCAIFAPLTDSKQEGRASWNASEARRCFGFVEESAKACDAAKYLFGIMDEPECGLEALITGKVPRGETCYYDLECADPDATCVPEEPPTDTDVVTARGVCEGPPVVGEACPGGVCSVGAFCDQSGASPICAALKADGQPCYDPGECESGICGAGGSCEAKKADGETCIFNQECVSELCDAEPDPAVCAPRRADGAACTYGEQCDSTFCDPAAGLCAQASAAGDVTYALCEG
ncbi:MAG: hypothetical protein P1V51_16820 [Deltaproteobacteria bacterium]|nr:hypothetical protein [Deltaproteobacteria bacterium]